MNTLQDDLVQVLRECIHHAGAGVRWGTTYLPPEVRERADIALTQYEAEKKLQPLAVPHPGSPEASAAIDAVLATYNWPSNPKNAARAGYMACVKLLKVKPEQPRVVQSPAEGDSAEAQLVALMQGLQIGMGMRSQPAVAFGALGRLIAEQAAEANVQPKGTEDWHVAYRVFATKEPRRNYIVNDRLTEAERRAVEASGDRIELLYPPATQAPAPGAAKLEDFCGVMQEVREAETARGTKHRIAKWTCPNCGKVCSTLELDGEWCHGDGLCISFVNGERIVRCTSCWLDAQAAPSPAVVDGALTKLMAHHAALLEHNSYAYFELAYTRSTGWMAWITDKPAKGEPGTAEYARSRKVIARGQGDTPEEAAADALAAMGESDVPVQGTGGEHA